MSKESSMPLRVDNEFRNMLREVRLERVKQGKDTDPLSLTRLTKAIKNIPNLKDTLIKANIKKLF